MTTIDWERYQQCPVCFAELGKPCMDMTGFNAARGVHDVELAAEPHTGRKLRAGR